MMHRKASATQFCILDLMLRSTDSGFFPPTPASLLRGMELRLLCSIQENGHDACLYDACKERRFSFPWSKSFPLAKKAFLAFLMFDSILSVQDIGLELPCIKVLVTGMHSPC